MVPQQDNYILIGVNTGMSSIIEVAFNLSSKIIFPSNIFNNSYKELLFFGPYNLSEGKHELIPESGFKSNNIKFFAMTNADFNKIISNQEFFHDNNIDIDYKKINPVHYKVNVNASSPYILMFEQNFDPRWKAYYGKRSVFFPFNSIPKDQHFKVNGAMNGWYIDKSDETEITILYSAQFYAVWGTIITLIMLLTVIYLNVLEHTKHQWKKRIRL